MRDERVKVTVDHRDSGWIGAAVIASERLELLARLTRGAGLIECLPPARLDLGVMGLSDERWICLV